MTRIDAHLHLWDPALGVYGWLTPGHGRLYAAFGPSEAHDQLSAAGVDGAVLVQAADATLDTAHLLGLAAEHPWIRGVVGWIDLEDPDGAEAALDSLAALPGGRVLCGIRQLVHDDERTDVLGLDSVARTNRVLAARGLPLDVPDAFPRQLTGAIALASANEDLVVVLDHLAKPPRGLSALTEWERQLRAAARLDNVVAKVSGLHAGASPYDVESLRPVLEIALEAFGSSRLMIGSDWPVSLLGAEYADTMAPLDALVEELSPDERDDLWWRTATRTYLEDVS